MPTIAIWNMLYQLKIKLWCWCKTFRLHLTVWLTVFTYVISSSKKYDGHKYEEMFNWKQHEFDLIRIDSMTITTRFQHTSPWTKLNFIFFFLIYLVHRISRGRGICGRGWVNVINYTWSSLFPISIVSFVLINIKLI
jgi:hypothetical protein